MTVAETIARSTLPAPAHVAGLRLLPLRLGHVRLLDALGVADPQTVEELVIAALVCSRLPAAFERLIGGRWSFLLLRWFAWRQRRRDWLAERELWLAYWREHNEVGEFLVRADGGEGPSAAAPFWQRLRVILMSHLGWPADKVDDAPWLQSLWDLMQWAENEGRGSITSDQEEAIFRELERAEAERTTAA